MKPIIIILIAVFLLGISIFTVNSYNASISKSNLAGEDTDKSNAAQNNVSTTPTETLDFTLKDLDGNEVSLSDLKGKKVFLNFWATWCPPCKAEMPEIEQLYQDTKDSDLVIVAVEIGEPLDTVKSFIDSNKFSFKVLLDSDQSVASSYNIVSIPTSYFIDEDGNIISKKVGAMNLDEMTEYVKNLDK